MFGASFQPAGWCSCEHKLAGVRGVKVVKNLTIVGLFVHAGMYTECFVATIIACRL